MSRISGRFVIAVISSIVEESLIAVIVMWLLPKIGVNMPMPGLVALMVGWACLSIFTYRKGSHALRRKPMVSLPDMVGSQGMVVSRLAPEGFVKIRGELWSARALDGELEINSRVIVVGQDRLKLDVRASEPMDGPAEHE
jgi:membrane-bound ClpP family serine protease